MTGTHSAVWKRGAGAAALAVLIACGAAYLTAPPNSSLTLVANPTFIAAHGGVSELTAYVFEPAGTPVANGTVVFWNTDLGHVDPETRTHNGVARNRLISDSRSGTARVCAFLGNENAAAPTPRPSGTGADPGGVASAASRQASIAAAAACSGEFEDIDIGNIRVRAIRLRAVPPRITISNSTHVIATVIDEFGNPIPNVPVYFTVLRDLETEFFDSAGAPLFTNNNGEAEDVLRTRRNTTGTARVQACATGPGNFTVCGTLDIPVL